MRHQKRLLLLETVILALCLTACGIGAEKEEDPPIEEITIVDQPYFGAWEISDYQAEGVTGHTLDGANEFLGYTITYQSDAILQNEQAVDIEKIAYEAQPYTDSLFIENYGINLGEWWSGVESVSRITVDAEEAFLGDCFFVVDDETIWIYFDEVVYLAKRN